MAEVDTHFGGMNPPQPWQPVQDKITLAILGKLIEELNECGSVAARSIIQGLQECNPKSGRRNAVDLVDELADVQAKIDITLKHIPNVDRAAFQRRVDMKTAHLLGWHAMLVSELL